MISIILSIIVISIIIAIFIVTKSKGIRFLHYKILKQSHFNIYLFEYLFYLFMNKYARIDNSSLQILIKHIIKK